MKTNSDEMHNQEMLLKKIRQSSEVFDKLANSYEAAETGIRMTAREKILQIGQSCRSCLRLITVIIRWQTAIFNMALMV